MLTQFFGYAMLNFIKVQRKVIIVKIDNKILTNRCTGNIKKSLIRAT